MFWKDLMKVEITKNKIAVVVPHEEFFLHAVIYQFGQWDSSLSAQIQNTEQ